MSLDSFKTTEMDFGIKVGNTEELADLSEYEKYSINELEADIEIKGRPHIMYFENADGDERTYESLRLQIINDKEKEVLNCYCNIPLGYPVIKNIRSTNNFYKNTYNLITGVYFADKDLDETVFYDSEANQMNTIKEINIKGLSEYINTKKEMKVKIVENGDYNTFVVIGLK